jgi:dolichol-phosphate mannosyltransferase
VQVTSWSVACTILIIVQAAFASRAIYRMSATARGSKILASAEADASCVSIIVPVLDEELRIETCLAALRSQGPALLEVVVVDGGSVDGTQALVRTATQLDRRFRLVVAPPSPAGWNGKAWNLEVGLREVSDTCRFVATVDADVQVSPQLASSLAAHAKRTGLRAFSVATKQRVCDAIGSALHPSMLATLVYRFGIPGTATTSARQVQANGQCFFAEREVLVATGAIALARASRCEDVTMARAIAASGTPVGFFEAETLAETTMYANWRELFDNWPRSLAMLDRYSGYSGWFGLLQIVFAQALPLWMLLASVLLPELRAVAGVEAALVTMRLGVLAGTRRAYSQVAGAYWLSPLMDALSVAAILTAAVRRRHVWRGRVLVRDAG